MAKPVTVVTVLNPSAVEIGGTPLPLVPARLFSSSENRAVRRGSYGEQAVVEAQRWRA